MVNVLRRSFTVATVCALLACIVSARPLRADREVQSPDRGFLQNHCIDCHQGADAGGGLDLAKLGQDLHDAKSQQHWIRIVDRIAAGEMPPKDAEKVEPAARAQFVQSAGEWLRSHQKSQDALLGRVRGRRLTRRELERSLQDLLGIDIPLADQLPEEANTAEFSTVASGQAMSHFQLERHVAVLDVALDEAFRRALTPEDRYDRDFDAEAVARRPDRGRTREPEILDGRAVTWSSGLIFYGRIPTTTAPENGWYQFRVRVSGLKLPSKGGVWTTVRSGLCVSSAPLLAWIASFEATDEPRELDFEAWLPKGHMLEIRPGDATLKKARFAGGQVGNGEGEPQDVPGIAIERVTMKRFHRGPDNEGVRRLLLDDLEVERSQASREANSDGQSLEPRKFPEDNQSPDNQSPDDRRSRDGRRSRRDRQSGESSQLRPVSLAPREDLARLITRFAQRAFRRPVSETDIAPYIGIAVSLLDEGQDFTSALRLGYRAVLCSPRFLYFTELPGKLDDYAIATRLSYFLTGSTPDDELFQLAAARRLHEPEVLHEQVERFLKGARARWFIQDFSAEWLDLDLIDFTEPDRKLCPDFDAIVQQSMLDETHTYLETMLSDNLGTRKGHAQQLLGLMKSESNSSGWGGTRNGMGDGLLK